MWLNEVVRAGNALLREDGAYGALAVAEDLDGDGNFPDTVQALLDPAHTKIWSVESGVSKAWATRLIDVLGVAPSTPLGFDRATGAVTATLADAAAAPAEAPVTPSSHLALVDVVLRDDRIPPWRMDFSEASKRNALPVPADRFLAAGVLPGAGALYLHYDDVPLDPPAGARRAEVALLYQTASWEYVQFLWKANDRGNAFLASVGDDLLEAWLATGHSAPVVMATLRVPEPGTGPPGIIYGEATCARCGMILKDPRFAGALRFPEPGGGTRVVIFDDIGELFLTLVKPGAPAPSEIWVHDGVTEKWIDGRRAVYVRGEIRSPMGLGVEAHAGRDAALRRAGEVKGEAMDFGALKEAAASGRVHTNSQESP
jgi:hypothetical protein